MLGARFPAIVVLCVRVGVECRPAVNSVPDWSDAFLNKLLGFCLPVRGGGGGRKLPLQHTG